MPIHNSIEKRRHSVNVTLAFDDGLVQAHKMALPVCPIISAIHTRLGREDCVSVATGDIENKKNLAKIAKEGASSVTVKTPVTWRDQMSGRSPVSSTPDLSSMYSEEELEADMIRNLVDALAGSVVDIVTKDIAEESEVTEGEPSAAAKIYSVLANSGCIPTWRFPGGWSDSVM